MNPDRAVGEYLPAPRKGTSSIVRSAARSQLHQEEIVEEHQVAPLATPDVLLAEIERLKTRCAHIQTQARVWKMEARTQQSITKDIGILLGGIPDHGPLVSEVEKLVIHERQRDEVEFSYDIYTQVVKICGTQISRCLFENWATSSGEDECYRHVRSADGVIMVTRSHGHRRMIAILTGAVKQLRDELAEVPLSPLEPEDIGELRQHVDTADALLAAIDHEIPEEARRVEAVLQKVREFRLACRSGLTETELKQADHDQLAAVGALFAELELLDLLRDRLIETGKPVTEKP
jgi:hypothetical protein